MIITLSLQNAFAIWIIVKLGLIAVTLSLPRFLNNIKFQHSGVFCKTGQYEGRREKVDVYLLLARNPGGDEVHGCSVVHLPLGPLRSGETTKARARVLLQWYLDKMEHRYIYMTCPKPTWRKLNKKTREICSNLNSRHCNVNVCRIYTNYLGMKNDC